MRDMVYLSDKRQAPESPPAIQTLRISAQAFAPYGDLLEAPAQPGRSNFVANFENHRPHACANIALVRCDAAEGRLRIDEMECHPFSSQIFFPLDVNDYLVVVAKDDGAGNPDPGTLVAFQVSHPQGINYHPGTWHIGMIALSHPGTFALLVHEDGSADDCRFRRVGPFTVAVSQESSPSDD
ncbi:ureidoglycolate lyase [Microvirga sp. M2]|uniref:ureidoglycolate lyase n=1 Tax=Microvirga sp. M2 TaxID=3073270 RepID=UPI0039C0A8A1